MKKIISIILFSISILMLSACSNTGTQKQQNPTNNASNNNNSSTDTGNGSSQSSQNTTTNTDDYYWFKLSSDGKSYYYWKRTNTEDPNPVIPSTYEGLPVTGILERAFNGSSITSVKLPDKLEKIGRYAFTNCQSLTAITFPKTLTFIGDSAFMQCYKLATVRFNGTIEEWKKVTRESSCWVDIKTIDVICSDGTTTLVAK